MAVDGYPRSSEENLRCGLVESELLYLSKTIEDSDWGSPTYLCQYLRLLAGYL